MSVALPDELLTCVFRSLGALDLASCALVCRHWHAVSSDQVLWRERCLQLLPAMTGVASRASSGLDFRSCFFANLLPPFSASAVTCRLILDRTFLYVDEPLVLSGNVVLRAPTLPAAYARTDTRLRSVELLFEGTELFFAQRFSLARITVPLRAAFTVPPGITRLPFRITLPDRLPPSFDLEQLANYDNKALCPALALRCVRSQVSRYAHIVYRLRLSAPADRLFGSSLVAEAEVLLCTPLRKNDPAAPSPSATADVSPSSVLTKRTTSPRTIALPPSPSAASIAPAPSTASAPPAATLSQQAMFKLENESISLRLALPRHRFALWSSEKLTCRVTLQNRAQRYSTARLCVELVGRLGNCNTSAHERRRFLRPVSAANIATLPTARSWSISVTSENTLPGPWPPGDTLDDAFELPLLGAEFSPTVRTSAIAFEYIVQASVELLALPAQRVVGKITATVPVELLAPLIDVV